MEYFYSQIQENEHNKSFIDFLRSYAEQYNESIYLLDHPLIDSKYQYDIKNVGILLMRKHKISFISFSKTNAQDAFEDYKLDVLEDINSLSDTYNYRNLIGRVRNWTSDLVSQHYLDEITDYNQWIKSLVIDAKQYRKLELIITLFIGSINEVSKLSLEKADSLIEKVKQKIQMFDGEQTRFIYGDLDNTGKQIIVQGLSGTGKTELMLHKLREVYLSNPELPIGFTCFNVILANSLRQRIPRFFDFMMVNKQIDWNKLLCVNSWGNFNNFQSGIYRYICHYYEIPFFNYRQSGSFDKACQMAIAELKRKKNDNNFAFSYIFIDESQDFYESFFELCEMVTQERVYIAGDIFQSIFDGHADNAKSPMFVLSNCYRTDPKTLMIAHALGLGLYEKEKLWWLNKEQWEQCGYKVKIEDGNNFLLTRYPLHRFDDDDDSFPSFELQSTNNICNGILQIIQSVKKEFPDVKEDDIGIVFIDDENYIYDISAQLESEIPQHLGWKVNIAYETKKKIPRTLFISNRNNVKGLEFPIIICFTKEIKRTISYRNTLYTMLTRSFLRSYLLVEEKKGNGISYEIQIGINQTLKNKCIESTEPSEKEKQAMHKWFEGAKHIESLNDKIERIFRELKIENEKREKIRNTINGQNIRITDDENLSNLIKALDNVV